MYHRADSVLRIALVLVLFLGLAHSSPAQELVDVDEMRSWIDGFKVSPKGPFERIRWFCADGTVLPPRAYACRPHGGGIQHGELNAEAKALREGGYEVATVLADLLAEDFVGPEADLEKLRQILLERFLIDSEDGWIFRGARTYRGALQSEDEEAGARRVVLAMLADAGWREPARFFLLRESVRLLPLVEDEASAFRVRQLALEIAEADAAFFALRAKIHNVPDARDAERVREYAREQGIPAVAGDYEELAEAIDELYGGGAAEESAAALAQTLAGTELGEIVAQAAVRLAPGTPAAERVAGGLLLRQLRDGFAQITDPERALALLTTSIALEGDVYAAGNTLLSTIGGATRSQRLDLLGTAAAALYGTGFLSERQRASVEAGIARLEAAEDLSLRTYGEELRYLARVPEWGGRWVEFHFGGAMAHLGLIEPGVALYSQDRVRGSALLFYSRVIDGLTLDANQSAGIEHQLFGEPVGSGLRALNPGLARGVLRSADAELQADGIYLLSETTSELPPVAGILTLGEGSSLSHVQLLARNLGIPNVVVVNELLPRVQENLGTPAILAVSPAGVVQLVEDTPRWDALLGEESSEPQTDIVIRPDLEKLDLEASELLSLSVLRASDSGRTSGPKGANLGELTHHFGNAVPGGFVIPFGAFRRLLDQPLEAGGPSVFEWMRQSYDELALANGQPNEPLLVSTFLQRLRSWILTADPGPEFRESLRVKLAQEFGTGVYGVFVRSDTNVEDLPGFTGAGLNLTVPNVVGYDNLLEAIREVWASPFSERSYAWRQSLMPDPEYVFPAVVIQRALPSKKSGVIVTADVEEGRSGWISVAVSEGVGGAVEGQATESLRIDTRSGEVRFLAQATAPERMELKAAGGIEHVPTSGTDEILLPGDIAQLIELADLVPERVTSLRDESGAPLPADIEFAFYDGRLYLLQIRPFVESRSARENIYLSSLDTGLRARQEQTISLAQVPRMTTTPDVSAGEERP